MTDGYDDTDCVDADGRVHPEHGYPELEEGVECRRCGAENPDYHEPDGIYDGEIR